ncbi:MAG: tryptophan-rich sensory protein [Acidobacteriota bacterium]|nr:tryptophan-rich sensory protein [Acidobacteriota bacterium]
MKQPVFAPPDWSFAPAWTLNNALAIWGLLRVLNMPKQKSGRDAFISLQTAFWITFVAFNPLYFGLRSPVLGAIDTSLGLALTVASDVAVSRLKGTETALSQSTTLLWLLLAAATATTMAAWNEDEFCNFRPLVEPSPSSAWMKQ